MLFKTTPLCEQWRLTRGRLAIQPLDITWLVVRGASRWASRTQGKKCKGSFHIEQLQQALSITETIQQRSAGTLAVHNPDLKRLQWSFTTSCFYLIPVTHPVSTNIHFYGQWLPLSQSQHNTKRTTSVKAMSLALLQASSHTWAHRSTDGTLLCGSIATSHAEDCQYLRRPPYNWIQRLKKN